MKNKIVRFIGGSVLGGRRCDGLRRHEFPRLYAKPFDAWRFDDGQ